MAAPTNVGVVHSTNRHITMTSSLCQTRADAMFRCVVHVVVVKEFIELTI